MKFTIRNKVTKELYPFNSRLEMELWCKSKDIKLNTLERALREDRDPNADYELVCNSKVRNSHLASMLKNETRVLVVGDLHAPFQHPNYLDFCKQIYEKYRCNKVVFIGDILDNHCMSYHENSTEAKGINMEFEEALTEVQKWHNTFPQATVILGNHDCFDEETEILTLSGWKMGVDLTENDIVATYNMETKTVEYQKPTAIIKKMVEGEMLEFKTQSLDLKVTVGHRMMFMEKDHKCTDTEYKIKEAYKLSTGRKYLALASGNNKEDFKGISDSMLQLMAWVASDGSILGNGKFVLYQSKQKGIDKIESILNELGIQFMKTSRNRDTTHICGKELVVPPLESKEYFFKSDELYKIYKDKYKLPKELFEVSKRQFELFINSFIDGDGTRYAESGYRKHSNSKYSSAVIYGTETMIDQLQALCISNGWKATKRVFREKDFRLNVTPDRINEGIDLNTNSRLVQYKGIVWCAEVENSTLVVRRNGNVTIQGNCLVTRKAQSGSIGKQWLKEFSEVLKTPNWEYVTRKVIDGVLYTHGTGRQARSRCLEDHISVVQGHFHSKGYIEYFVGSNGQTKFALQVGCGVDITSYAMAYGRDFARPHINCGVVVDGRQAYLEYMEVNNENKDL